MVKAPAGLVFVVLLRVDHRVLHGSHVFLGAQRGIDHVTLAKLIFRSHAIIAGGYFFFGARANGLVGLAFA